MHSLPTFKLEEYFAEWEFKSRYLLSSSDVETLSLEQLLATANDEDRQLFHSLKLGYTETRGHPLLLQQIALLYEKMQPDHILTAAGAEEAIYAFFRAVISPGDEVIVFTPAYQSLRDVPASLGAAVVEIALHESRGWRPSMDEVIGKINSKTKCIVLNFPNNPTGSLLTLDELEMIVAKARQWGVYIFSDEVYRLLERDTQKRLPAVCDLYERGVSLSVMSKAFGLGGLRIGWLASQDKALLARVNGVKHYLSICNSALSEIIAMIALKAKESILARASGIIQENYPLLQNFFKRHMDRFSWVEPSGGCIAFPRLLQGQSDRFCKSVLENTGVLLLPGEAYKMPGGYFRIGFGRANFKEALAHLEEFLINHREQSWKI
ncbi:aminotransferase class I/II-fold pyridoxal phosphate-dependent enzyme [Estrella lausannensis]|uniref:Aminotransferase n=1 Tax=Estrella lausannensis TaxID=483423 RepID=A0A0H5DT51_9BACT|nr:aminotransferase class I/II-fold pyridoxal phosphate-dependent enzyme [Estrella lausannensis]CRX39538.1 Aminotransferase [Estrella lausannensis]